MGKAQACEQKPRQCFASGNHDPVDKVAIQEGNLLMRLLAAAVDAANLLSASCHPRYMITRYIITTSAQDNQEHSNWRSRGEAQSLGPRATQQGVVVGWRGGWGRGRDADYRLRRQGVAQRATGGEEWVLECAVSVVDRWMGHRAVRGVVGGLLVGLRDRGCHKGPAIYITRYMITNSAQTNT